MRRDSGRRVLAYAAAASVSLHLLLVVANPGMPPQARNERVRPAPPAGLPLVSIRELPRDVLPAVPPAMPRVSGGRAFAADSLAAVRVAPLATTAAPGLVERLRAARDPQLWRSPALPPETPEERALRETARRLAEVAAEQRGSGGGMGLYAGGGDIGVRIPFGRKPPPPAQTLPAPAPMVALRRDSLHRAGDVIHAFHSGYTLSYPAELRVGRTFTLHAQLPGNTDGVRVRAFVDGVSVAETTTLHGSASLPLRIDRDGERRILVHFLASDAAAQVAFTVLVEIG